MSKEKKEKIIMLFSFSGETSLREISMFKNEANDYEKNLQKNLKKNNGKNTKKKK